MALHEKNIVKVGRLLHSRNLLAAADGNISCRLEDGSVLITPTGVNKLFLEESHVAWMSSAGEVFRGQPSSEKHLHLACYEYCPEAQWVIHAHPPTAIAWSVAFPKDTELPGDSLSEVILAVGKIPIAPYARTGTPALVNSLKTYWPEHRVIIMARHGAISWGETWQEAYDGMERLEHCAQILKTAQELGGLDPLPEQEISELWKLRETLGDRSI